METIVIAVITTILSVVCTSCGRIANERYTKETAECQTEEDDTLEIERFRYFDLFTMQGIEPCDNDSCVTVIQRDKAIEIKATDPTTNEQYTITLTKEDQYWYSRAEFDMHKDKYNELLSLLEYGAPRRYDKFIRNDTIFEFCQIYSRNVVDKTVYVKTPDEYTIFDLKTENFTDTEPEKIYKKINDVVCGTNCYLTNISKWEVVRETDEVQFVSAKSGYIIRRKYPEVLIWGGNYGFGVEKSNTMLIGSK